MQACLDAADRLVSAAEAEAAAHSAGLDDDEMTALQTALGAGGTGKGAATAARGMSGALKDLERRQKSRATRAQRDALDRALTDLAAFYRDVLLVHAGASVASAHPDFDDDVRAVAAQVSPAGVLQRLDEVLGCREALELNVKPRIAVEAMTAALRLP
jgi:DNA polymerase-3 subunit delta'